VIASIYDEDMIQNILKHLNLWGVKEKPFLHAHAPTIEGFPIYNELPMPSVDNRMKDP